MPVSGQPFLILYKMTYTLTGGAAGTTTCFFSSDIYGADATDDKIFGFAKSVDKLADERYGISPVKELLRTGVLVPLHIPIKESADAKAKEIGTQRILIAKARLGAFTNPDGGKIPIAGKQRMVQGAAKGYWGPEVVFPRRATFY